MSCRIPEPVDVLKAVFIEALPLDIQEIITESCLEADVDILLDMVEQLEASPTTGGVRLCALKCSDCQRCLHHF